MICLLVVLTMTASELRSQDLMVFPKRLIFEGNNRTASINLSNVGQDTARYNISFLQYRMTETGGFEEITTPDSAQRFANPYLRFFPRSVTLAPNESQMIKIQLTKTDSLTPGEYRSHLYFRSVPKAIPLGEVKPEKQDSGISIRLIPVFGITIPVIIRVGEPDTKVRLSDATVTTTSDSTANLSLNIHRSGNMSIYGNITVKYTSPNGNSKQVGYAQGLSIYTPNIKRQFSLALEKEATDNFQKGNFHIEFSEDVNFRKVLRAEYDLNLP